MAVLFNTDMRTTRRRFRATAVQIDGKVLELLNVESHGISVRRLNADGSLDKSFGSGGMAVVSKQDPEFAGSSDSAVGMIVQSDRRIVVAGNSSSTFLIAPCVATDRLIPASTRQDIPASSPSFAAPKTLIQQSDGKLIMVGRAYNKLALARFQTNGLLDNSFGSYGRITIDLPNMTNETITSAAVQSDGKIIATGSSDNSDDFLVRFTSTGKLDTTFGKRGILLEPSTDIASDLVLGSGGKIVFGADVFDKDGNAHGSILRLHADGTADKTFGKNGVADLSDRVSDPTLLAIQNDGKILLGTSDSVVRADSNGKVDTTFGTKGVAHFKPFEQVNIYALALQADGKAIVAGSGGQSSSPPANESLVIRFDTNGIADSTFGIRGIATDDPTGRIGSYNDVVIQSDGKILAVGTTVSLASGSDDFLVARYMPDGTLDPTFGDHGRVTIDFGVGFDDATCVSVSGHKIIVSGTGGDSVNLSYFEITRLKMDGTIDKSFGINGRVLEPVNFDPGFPSTLSSRMEASSSPAESSRRRSCGLRRLERSTGRLEIADLSSSTGRRDPAQQARSCCCPMGNCSSPAIRPPSIATTTARLPWPDCTATAALIRSSAMTESHSFQLARISSGLKMRCDWRVDRSFWQAEVWAMPGEHYSSPPTANVKPISLRHNRSTPLRCMPSGRILLAGLTRSYLLRSDFSFSTSFPTETDTEIVAVQSDGEVIYAGGLELMDYPNSNTAPLLRRYLGEVT